MSLTAVLIGISILVIIFCLGYYASGFLASKLIDHNERRHQEKLDQLNP